MDEIRLKMRMRRLEGAVVVLIFLLVSAIALTSIIVRNEAQEEIETRTVQIEAETEARWASQVRDLQQNAAGLESELTSLEDEVASLSSENTRLNEQNESRYQEGYNAGYDIGYHEGHKVGYDKGKAEGYDDGKEDGYDTGYQAGKTAGTVRAPANNTRPSTSGSTQTNSVTVYITDTGSKYHRAGCQYLAKSSHPISKDTAIARGYEACSRCW